MFLFSGRTYGPLAKGVERVNPPGLSGGGGRNLQKIYSYPSSPTRKKSCVRPCATVNLATHGDRDPINQTILSILSAHELTDRGYLFMKYPVCMFPVLEMINKKNHLNFVK